MPKRKLAPAILEMKGRLMDSVDNTVRALLLMGVTGAEIDTLVNRAKEAAAVRSRLPREISKGEARRRINTVGFTHSALSALIDAKILTLGDLLDMTELELRTALGRKHRPQADSICDTLKALNYTLRPPICSRHDTGYGNEDEEEESEATPA